MSSSAVIVSLVLLLLATTVLGTDDVSGACTTAYECVSQEELATVMERRVDQLHSQLHYWQNVTVNILKDHYSSLDTSSAGSRCIGVAAVLESTVLNITQSNEDITERLDTLNDNISERLSGVNNDILNEKLDALNSNINGSFDTVNGRLDSLENSVEQIKSTAGQCCNGSFLDPAHNCSHILHDHPGSPSGHYWLQSSPGYAVKVYCDMERVCGCSGGGGGWMRVAHIDMTQPNENCPAGFRKVTANGKTMCGGQGSQCISTTFSPHGMQYSRVYGRITGYQYHSTDAFWSYITHGGSIDSNFVDGIVLTHGSPRTHIWTFVCGQYQYDTGDSGCPCNSDSFTRPLPPYIGNDYFCDSGYRYNSGPPLDYLTNDPLWDGAGCVSGSCCTFNSPPWFCKTLPHPTTDDIELRQCISGPLSDEDVLIEKVELYVQ